MLTVDDPTFWEGLEPVQMGQLPHLQQQVTVIGYTILSTPSWSPFRPAHVPVQLRHTCARTILLMPLSTAVRFSGNFGDS